MAVGIDISRPFRGRILTGSNPANRAADKGRRGMPAVSGGGAQANGLLWDADGAMPYSGLNVPLTEKGVSPL